MHKTQSLHYKKVYMPDQHKGKEAYNDFIDELTNIVRKYGTDTLRNIECELD